MLAVDAVNTQATAIIVRRAFAEKKKNKRTTISPSVVKTLIGTFTANTFATGSRQFGLEVAVMNGYTGKKIY